MQSYGKIYSELYDKLWFSFSKRIAPEILKFYEKESINKNNKKLLDLCCGNGTLSLFFLQKGYKVTGVDLSIHMLAYAKKNTENFVKSGNAKYICQNIDELSLKESFGLIVSTFDSMNHIEHQTDLKKIFRHTLNILHSDGYFIFDLNTEKGLRRWNRILTRQINTQTMPHILFWDVRSIF